MIPYRFIGRPSANQQRNVINRGEIPVVTRGTGGTGLTLSPGRVVILLILAGLVFLIFNHRPASRVPSEAVQVVNLAAFRVQSVVTTPTHVGPVTNWQVSGHILNTHGSALPTPDLQVQMVRPDGSVAGQTRLLLGGGTLESGETRRFSAKLQTVQGENVRTEVVPLPAQGGDTP